MLTVGIFWHILISCDTFVKTVQCIRSKPGVYKVPYPALWGKFIKSVGEEKNIKFGKRDRNIMAVGKNIMWKKGKGEPILSSL